MALECEVHRNIEKSTCNLYTQNINPLRKMSSLYRDIPLPWKKSQTSWRLPSPLCICSTQIPPHYGLRGCPIKKQKCLKKSGMVLKSQEWWQGIWNIIFFLPVIENYSDIQIIISNSALQCHLAAAFCFMIKIYFIVSKTLLLPSHVYTPKGT